MANRINPLLSILIPTKNREHYVSHAVRSALAIDSDLIEILCSENYGDDQTYDLLRSFNDPRLDVHRPPRPLPMHENFEFLLNKSTGEWVTFIGDDDAILPYCVHYLNEITKAFSYVEAIYSARSYFYWPNEGEEHGSLRLNLSNNVVLDSSKDTLRKILNGQIHYIYTPQIYSGGFQKRSLIQRVINAKGRYFFTSTPDANSSLNALIFTSKFLRVGFPFSVVGTSPGVKNGAARSRISKDRAQDHLTALIGSNVSLHPIVSDPENAPFTLWFLETYLNASPLVNLIEVDDKFIEPMVFRAIIELCATGKESSAVKLANHVGLSYPSEDVLQRFEKLFPMIFPDPIAGSQMLQASQTHKLKTISDAIPPMVMACQQYLSINPIAFRESGLHI